MIVITLFKFNKVNLMNESSHIGKDTKYDKKSTQSMQKILKT